MYRGMSQMIDTSALYRLLKETYLMRLIWCRFSFVILMHNRRRIFSVNPHVFFEVARFAKSFSANVANIRALAGMQPRMNDHFVPLSERFMAKLTLVGPGICMNSLVFSH